MRRGERAMHEFTLSSVDFEIHMATNIRGMPPLERPRRGENQIRGRGEGAQKEAWRTRDARVPRSPAWLSKSTWRRIGDATPLNVRPGATRAMRGVGEYAVAAAWTIVDDAGRVQSPLPWTYGKGTVPLAMDGAHEHCLRRQHSSISDNFCWDTAGRHALEFQPASRQLQHSIFGGSWVGRGYLPTLEPSVDAWHRGEETLGMWETTCRRHCVEALNAGKRAAPSGTGGACSVWTPLGAAAPWDSVDRCMTCGTHVHAAHCHCA